MPPFLRSFLSPTFFTLSLQLSHWFSEPYPPLLVTVFPSLVVRLFLKWCSLKWKPHTILFLSLFTFFILVFSRRHKHFKLNFWYCTSLTNKWCFGITKMREKNRCKLSYYFVLLITFFDACEHGEAARRETRVSRLCRSTLSELGEDKTRYFWCDTRGSMVISII